MTEYIIESNKKMSGFTFGEIGDIPSATNVSIQESIPSETLIKPSIVAPESVEVPKGVPEPLEEKKPLEVDDNKIQNKSLKDYSVKRITSVIHLEPLVVFTVVAENDDVDTIGIPGLYNATNDRFTLLDGSPVPAEGFDKEFSKFIAEIKKEGQNEKN